MAISDRPPDPPRCRAISPITGQRCTDSNQHRSNGLSTDHYCKATGETWRGDATPDDWEVPIHIDAPGPKRHHVAAHAFQVLQNENAALSASNEVLRRRCANGKALTAIVRCLLSEEGAEIVHPAPDDQTVRIDIPDHLWDDLCQLVTELERT